MKATFKSYVSGFILSVLLTIAGAGFVWVHVSSNHTIFSHEFLVGAALVLAFAQLLVQLVFFMHLGRETGPRWRLAALISTVAIVAIIVMGGIWIMNHLNYDMMMSSGNMNMYIQSQDGL